MYSIAVLKTEILRLEAQERTPVIQALITEMETDIAIITEVRRL